MHASIMLPTAVEVNWKVPACVLHLFILSQLRGEVSAHVTKSVQRPAKISQASCPGVAISDDEYREELLASGRVRETNRAPGLNQTSKCMETTARERLPRDIEVVFLDAGGTLFEVRGSVGQIYSRFGLRHGCSLDPREIDSAFVQAFKTAPPLAFPGLDESEACGAERLWWKEIIRKTLKGRCPNQRSSSISKRSLNSSGRSEAWHLFPDTRASLERLRRRGYRLGIVSNFDSRLDDVLSALDLNSFFDRVTVSSRAGAAKPSAAIFHEGLKAMQVSGSHAVHAGDSLEEDVEGARRAGLSAFLVDRQERYPGWTDGFRVRNLEELCLTLGS